MQQFKRKIYFIFYILIKIYNQRIIFISKIVIIILYFLTVIYMHTLYICIYLYKHDI